MGWRKTFAHKPRAGRIHVIYATSIDNGSFAVGKRLNGFFKCRYTRNSPFSRQYNGFVCRFPACCRRIAAGYQAADSYTIGFPAAIFR